MLLLSFISFAFVTFLFVCHQKGKLGNFLQDRSGFNCCGGIAAKEESTKILLGLATLGEILSVCLFVCSFV